MKITLLNPSKTFLLVFLMSLCIGVNAQQVFKTTPTSVISYLEYLPSDYNNNSNKYPIVISLHGIGERGPNSTDISKLEAGASTIAKHGPAKHVKNGSQFPFILISPQLKSNYGNWSTWYVMEVINHVKTYLRVDEKRIHITGLSLGGGGTWTMAQDYATLFASIAPVCGGYNAPSKACNIAAEKIPVWAFHGDADPTVGLSKSSNMVNAINKCTPTPSPLALLTVYPGVKHNAWDKAYTPNNTIHSPNVYEWMMSFTNTENGGNKIPTANAGSDKTHSSNSLSITGSGSDADGTIVSYNWTKISGPAATLTNQTSSVLKLSALVDGTYMFRLTVTDNVGNTDADYVKVTVNLNKVPVVNAGVDQSITLPVSSVTLTGSASDSDGTIASYAWTKVSGPGTPSLTNANTAALSVSNLTVAGTYTFKLTVKDNKGASKSDNVNVIVKEAPVKLPDNLIPVANAGKDKTITQPASSVAITGTGSDADGTIVSYAWKQLSGPKTAVLHNANTTMVSAEGLTVAGFYVFELTVTDNSGASVKDKMGVRVNPYTVDSRAKNIDAGWMDELASGDTQHSLTISSAMYWENKHVSIYNETGAQMYSGEWSSEIYQRVLNAPGLYLYNIQDNGSRIKTGKVIIVQ